ncbi:MAG: DNA polymerase I [Candidatus Babeliales bacterium]
MIILKKLAALLLALFVFALNSGYPINNTYTDALCDSIELPETHGMKFDPKKTIFLIDGSSYLYRAYYGMRPLHTIHGEPVQAVYSFCRMIQKLMKQFQPQYMSLVWDSKGKTVRHEIFPDYKATRQAPPSDLFTQKEHIIEFADLIGLHQIATPGIEADDLMCSLAREYEKQGFQVVLVTADKDMGQCISDKVVLYDSFKDKFYDRQAMEERFGFALHKLPFYFALLGDTSDNIPGVKGIGEKGATELAQQFDSLEDAYANLDKIEKNRTRNALIENKENAFLSRDLFLLREYDTGVTLENLAFNATYWPKARPLFEKLEFASLVKEIAGLTGVTERKEEWLSKSKGYKFITIDTQEKLDALVHEINTKKLVAIDTELTGLNPLYNHLVGISACTVKGVAYYIPFAHTTGERQLSRDVVLAAFKKILEDPSIKKIMHHAKFDEHAFMHYGIMPQGLVFDTLLAAHLVTEDWQRNGLKYLSEYFLNEPMISFQEAVINNGFKTFAQVPLELATEYAASDAHQTWQLYPILVDALVKQDMAKLYQDIEFPLVDILTYMEYRGINLDTEILKTLNVKIDEELTIIKEKINALVGPLHKDINLNSPRQLAILLFEHLRLPPQKQTDKKTGYSTDQEVLEALAHLHPVPALILRHRELFKLKSTYIEALPSYVNPETGKIHTTFRQTLVATGRLSSQEPNLQNVPTNSFEYKGNSVRSAFKPEPGHVFIAADYSQIELRVLAYLSQDKSLLDAFLHDEDIHKKTAANLFDTTSDKVTSEQRQIGKRINFSILYGLTPFGLSQDLKIPFKDAKIYIEKYFAQYPGVSAWMDKIIEETKAKGYVTTHFGRRRYVSGIHEKNKSLYEQATRIAINTVAQGTAAELMKIGMINLERAFKEHKLDANMILQIHDELLISVREDQAQKTEKIIRETLENVVSWNVPLVVTTSTGKDWKEVTK